jgi:hypothetical protein
MFIAKRINIILPRDKKVVQTNVRLRTVSQLYQYVKDTSKKKKKKKKKKLANNFVMYQYIKSTRK